MSSDPPTAHPDRAPSRWPVVAAAVLALEALALVALAGVYAVGLGRHDEADFGRALASNGNGTDHGWGGHHLIVGGAVRGKAFYGTPPPLSAGDSDTPENQWHIGQGRLIPSTSVEQYAATLARWFGVGEGELAGILPNLKNFGAAAGQPADPADLGFMAS